MMNNRVSVEFIPTAIRYVIINGLCFLLCTTPEKVSDGELLAVRTRDSYEHVSVLVIHDVAHSILTERVADLLTIDAPVFPRYESPGANERISCHGLFLKGNSFSFCPA